MIGEVALKVFGTHAWYLTSAWAISVLFSRLIGIEEKKELVNKNLFTENHSSQQLMECKMRLILSILIHVFSSEY